MKMYTDDNYGGNVTTRKEDVNFRVKDPDGFVSFAQQGMVTSGDVGYIDTYEKAVHGPNGVYLNGTEITNGYDALTYTAQDSGSHWIEFDCTGWYLHDRWGWLETARFALQYFDVTVTDNLGNIRRIQ
jgi:hypothetical protein